MTTIPRLPGRGLLAPPVLLLLCGCISEQSLWDDYHARPFVGESLSGTIRYPGGVAPALSLDSDGLAPPRPFEAHASEFAVSVIVNAEGSLRKTAPELAAILGAGWRHMRTSLGYDPGLRPRFVVVPVDELPREVRLTIRVVDDRVRFPLLWREGADIASMLADNQVALAICVHELVEVGLIRPALPPTALPDITWSLGPFQRHVVAGTRWFRDGLAHYAGSRFLDGVDAALLERWPDRAIDRWPRCVLASIDSLARVGASLFDWSQTDDDLYRDHYPAACALFLLFEERLGTEAFHGFLRAVEPLEHPDGAALEGELERFLGRSPRAWAAGIASPTGVRLLDPEALRAEIQVEPGGPAARAGLATGDRLVEIDGDRRPDLITLELAVLRAATAGRALEVEVLRRGESIHLRWAPPSGRSK